MRLEGCGQVISLIHSYTARLSSLAHVTPPVHKDAAEMQALLRLRLEARKMLREINWLIGDVRYDLE